MFSMCMMWNQVNYLATKRLQPDIGGAILYDYQMAVSRKSFLLFQISFAKIIKKNDLLYFFKSKY